MMQKVALCLALFVVAVAGQCNVPGTEFVCIGTPTVVRCGKGTCQGVCVRFVRCNGKCRFVYECRDASTSCGPGTCPLGTQCTACPDPIPEETVPLADVISSSLSDALGTVTYTDAVANGGNAYTGGYSTGDYGFSRSDSGAFDDGTAVAYTDVDATLGYEAQADSFATSNPGPPSPPATP